jgi:hypothetical protein
MENKAAKKWAPLGQSSDQATVCLQMLFVELPPKIPLNSGQRFCETELEHTKRFLRLSHYFTAMTTVVFLVAITGVTSLIPHPTQN